MSRKQRTVVTFELDTNGSARRGGSGPRGPTESSLKSSSASLPRVVSGLSKVSVVERPRARASPGASKSQVLGEVKHVSFKKQTSREMKSAALRNRTPDEAPKHVSTKSILLTKTIPSVSVKQMRQENGLSRSPASYHPVPSPRHVSTKYVVLKPSLGPQETAVSVSSGSVSSQRHVSSISASIEPPKPLKRSFQDITPRHISPSRLERSRQVSRINMAPQGTTQRHVVTKTIQTQPHPAQHLNGRTSQPQPAPQTWNRRISQEKSASPARQTKQTQASPRAKSLLPQPTTQLLNGRVSRRKDPSPTRQTQQTQASPRTAAPRRLSLPNQQAGRGAGTDGGWSGAATHPAHQHSSKETHPKPHPRASCPAKPSQNYQRISDSPVRKPSKNLAISGATVPPSRSGTERRGSPGRVISASTAPARLLSPGLVSSMMKPPTPRHNKASRLRCSFLTIKVAFHVQVRGGKGTIQGNYRIMPLRSR